MKKEKYIKEDDFYDKFIPVKNHIDKNASFDGKMFETYGKEVKYVHKMSLDKKKGKHVWTILEADGKMYYSAGFHIVNRLGYLITKKPWETGLEEVELEEVE